MVLGADSFRIPQRFVAIDAIDAEIARSRTALDSVCHEVELHEKLAAERLGAQYAAIFSAHLMMIRDVHLIAEIESLIRNKSFSPEYASSRVLRQYAKKFQNLGDHYLSEALGRHLRSRTPAAPPSAR